MRLSIPVSMIAVLAVLPAASALRGERVVLVAGGGTGGDGSPASQSKLIAPFGVDMDKAGNIYIVEMAGGERVRKVDKRGIITTVAGTGEKGDSGDGRPAQEARFNGMHTLAVGPDNEIYVGDTWNSRVRKFSTKSGIVSAFGGTGQRGFSGDDGPALQANFGNVYCVAFGPKAAHLYLADLDNRRIRAIDMKTGVVRTVAGNGKKGVPEDGTLAVAAPLVDPRAVAVDAKGNVYVLERSGNALRVVDPQGKIRTVAGTGEAGGSGDGGDARLARLSGPKHLCIDRAGNVVIADTDNHVIRKYLPREGRIIRWVGSGHKGTGGVGGPPELLEMNQPHGVFVDASGTLYIADSLNNRVLRIDH